MSGESTVGKVIQMSHSSWDKRLGIVLAVGMIVALTVSLSLASPALAGSDSTMYSSIGTTRHSSTGTVVIAKSNASGVIKVVGTSTITVRDGVTVQQVEAQIVAKDKSKQTYTITDQNNNVRTSGAIQDGDRLLVTAANGQNHYTYVFAIYDPSAKVKDGVYWNENLYNEIDQTVNANVPVFPDNQCNVTDARYASLVRQVTDGEGSSLTLTVWYYGDAINAAIADCNARGGGIVVVPATGSRNAGGVYYSGAITLLSNVNLDLEEGATVKFVRNPTNVYYPVVLTSREGTDLYNYSPLVYALNQTNIAITGGGTLDAQDNVSHWQLPAGIPGAPLGTNAVLNNMNYGDVPVSNRIFTDDGHMPATIPVIVGGQVEQIAPPAGAVAYKTTFTPNFIEFNHSANILVQDVTVRNTIFWQVHPLNSENILIRGLDVSDIAHHTDDGIDVESCKNVVVENNSVTVLDDAVAIKSGRNLDGRKYRSPSQDIIIRNNAFYNPNGGSASISTGSEMSGGVYDVFAENNQSSGGGTAYVLKIKTNAYRGGIVQDIYVRNSVVNQTIRGIVNFDTNYSESVKYPNADIFNPTIRNIYIDHVDAAPTVTTTYPAFVISSGVSRSPVENVYYRNSTFYTTATFESAFSSSGSKFFKNLVIDNVKYINWKTLVETWYNTSPLNLLDVTTANVGGAAVPLTAVSINEPNVINAVSANNFTVSGRVDLAASPGFVTGGTVRVLVDRNTTAIPVTLNADGSFTSGTITLDDNQYWYVDRHYVAVNFFKGININTMVYQVAVVAGG
jgi:polygalacturonase